jgi:4-hydroxy-3-methylbut-2-enyl diphosphate reductase
VVLVVGSPNSSNSNRLREVAESEGVPAYMVDGPDDIERSWIKGKKRIGITAGASAPEVLVQQVVNRLKQWGVEGPEEVQGQQENVVFALPKELREVANTQ